jgi:hypothetical protein
MTQQEKRSKAVIDKVLKNSSLVKEMQEIKKMKFEHAKMKAALIKLYDCAWTMTLSDRGDIVRKIAMKALEGINNEK